MDVPQEILDLLGVRVKIGTDGVKVIRFQLVDGKLWKYVLENDGNWRVIGEGESYPGIRLVYRQADFNDPAMFSDVCSRCNGSGVESIEK